MIYLILLLALILRLIAVNQSFWLDEAIQVLESTVSFDKVWQIYGDFHPPLFHYLAFFWLKVCSVEWWARFLSIFLGIGSIYFLFLQAKDLLGKRVALLASLFVATSPFHIYYSQEFRPYMLSCFLATLSSCLFFKLLRSKQRIHWLFIITNIAGFYSLYIFPFIFITQLFIILLFYKEKLLHWIANLLLSFLFFLPWLPVFFKQLSIGQTWAVNYPLWKGIVATPLFESLPLVLTKFWLGNISFENKFFYGFLTFILFIFFSFLAFKALEKKRKETFIVLSLFVVPILTAFFISIFLPIIAPKRLLLTLPYFYILLAAGVVSFNKRWQKQMMAVILVINIFSLSRYYLNPRFQREQWRQAVSWVESQVKKDSLVLFEFGSPFGSWDFYQKGEVESKAVFERGFEVDLAMPDIIRNKKQIFLFQYLQEMTDPEEKVSKWLRDNGFILKQTVDFPGVGFIYEYRK